MHLLKHWRTPHQQIGQVIRATVAWMQYQVGIKESIFVDTKTPIEYVYGRFCHVARNYLNNIDAMINKFPKYVQKSLQINDETIMGRVNILKQFSGMQRKRINCVQM